MEAGEEFGPWLARQLKIAGKTQAELAEELGLTRAAVSAWITKRSVPRATVMGEIAKALGTDLGTVHTRTTDTQAGLPVTWYHRPGYPDGGRDGGNAAAFAFDADVQVLARETCQNSLDERLVENGRPVRVRYTIHELTGEALEAFRAAILWDELQPHYLAVSESAADQKVGRVVDAGVRDMFEKGRLILLRVDDYNASGLIGDDYDDGKFAAVVRRQLESLKSGSNAGGSYGLGKATLWATSALGMVLINSTLSVPTRGAPNVVSSDAWNFRGVTSTAGSTRVPPGWGGPTPRRPARKWSARGGPTPRRSNACTSPATATSRERPSSSSGPTTWRVSRRRRQTRSSTRTRTAAARTTGPVTSPSCTVVWSRRWDGTSGRP